MGEFQRLMQRYSNLSKSQGFGEVMGKAVDKFRVYCETPIKKRTFGKQKFVWCEKTLNYYVSSYNATWRNERAIEVPIMLDFFESNKGKQILEIGNVSAYYGMHGHTVIDKYEKSPSVINQDIVEANFEKKFDGIVSISTLEHVGWDEKPRSRDKILVALKRIKSFTNNLDNVLVSYPIGYSEYLDQLILKDSLPFKKSYYYVRKKYDQWEETSKEDILKVKFGHPFPAANGVVFSVGMH